LYDNGWVHGLKSRIRLKSNETGTRIIGNKGN
jgi:hypothetical protein